MREEVRTLVETVESYANEATNPNWFMRSDQNGIYHTDQDGFMIPIIKASLYPGEEGKVFANSKNTEFICNARRDILPLCTEVRRLDAEVERLETENERLRGALKLIHPLSTATRSG